MFKDVMKQAMEDKKDIAVSLGTNIFIAPCKSDTLPPKQSTAIETHFEQKQTNTAAISDNTYLPIRQNTYSNDGMPPTTRFNSPVQYRPYRYIQEILTPLKGCTINLPTCKDVASKMLLEKLSPEFQKKYGIQTLTPSSPSYGIDLTDCFLEYLEKAAKKVVTSHKKCGLMKIMSTDEFTNPISLHDSTWYYFGTNGISLPGIHAQSEKSDSLISLLSKICNCDRNKAAAILAALLGISFENLYNFTADAHAADTNANDVYFLSLIPESLAGYTLYDQKDIIGFSGQKIAEVVTYVKEGQFLNLVASISKKMLAFGAVMPTAYFMNQTEIDSTPKATVFFFQSYIQARAFERCLAEFKTVPQDIIITAPICSTDLKTLPWTVLLNRNIIFICEIDRYGFSMFENYQKIFKEYNIIYTVYPFPLLFHEFSQNILLKEPFMDNCSDLELALIDNAILIDSFENASNLISHIESNALQPDEFYAWLKEVKLIKADKSSPEMAKSSSISIPLLQLTDVSASPDDYRRISLTEFFCGDNITLIHGRKNSGKTYVSLSIAIALALGSGCYNFIQGTPPIKGLYFDGETLPKVLHQRMKQFNRNNAIDVFSLKQVSNNDSNWGGFNLAEETYREKLTELLIAKQYDFLVLDNISCLIGNRGPSLEDVAQKIMNWVTYLSNKKISVLIIHHTSEDKEKIAGSDIWRRRGTNEVQLIGKQDLSAYPNLPTSIKNIASNKGLFIGIRYNSSKSCSILENKIAWNHLPFNDSQWNFLGWTDETGKALEEDSEDSYAVACKTAEFDTSEEQNAVLNSFDEECEQLNSSTLSDKLQEYYDKIHEKYGTDEFSRSNVEELFGVSKGKACNILRDLKLSPKGSGNNITYSLCRTTPPSTQG